MRHRPHMAKKPLAIEGVCVCELHVSGMARPGFPSDLRASPNPIRFGMRSSQSHGAETGKASRNFAAISLGSLLHLQFCSMASLSLLFKKQELSKEPPEFGFPPVFPTCPRLVSSFPRLPRLPPFGGTVVVSGVAEMEVTASAAESFQGRIKAAVADARGSRSEMEELVNRFAEVYTPATWHVFFFFFFIRCPKRKGYDYIYIYIYTVPPRIAKKGRLPDSELSSLAFSVSPFFVLWPLQVILALSLGLALCTDLTRGLTMLVSACPCAVVAAAPVVQSCAFVRLLSDLQVLVKDDMGSTGDSKPSVLGWDPPHFGCFSFGCW